MQDKTKELVMREWANVIADVLDKELSSTVVYIEDGERTRVFCWESNERPGLYLFQVAFASAEQEFEVMHDSLIPNEVDGSAAKFASDIAIYFLHRFTIKGIYQYKY